MVYLAHQLLAAATSLLLLVQGNLGIDFYTREYAIQSANNAISYANQVISQGNNPQLPPNYPYPPYPLNPYQPTVSTIKVPFILRRESTDYYGRQVCNDEIIYVTRNITPTTEPLNAAYRELFNANTFYSTNQYYSNYYYDNSNYSVIPRLYNLKFLRANIENGTAHVYLKGSFEGNLSGCDLSRPQMQIEAVAKQFSNVYSIQIHLSD